MKRSPLRRKSNLRRTPFKAKRKPTRVTKDGRLIMGQRDYTFLRLRVWATQGFACGECRRSLHSLDSMELHHVGGRGMAGSKRDDRKVIGLCRSCHAKVTPKPEWSKKER